MAKAIKVRIFTEDDFSEIKEAQRELSDTIPLMDKAEQCGVKCEVLREKVSELTDILKAINKHFMAPGMISKSQGSE